MRMPAAAASTTITTGDTPKNATAKNVTMRMPVVGASTTPFFVIFQTDCSTSAHTATRMPEKLLDAVIADMKADIPQAMIESQLDSMVQDFGYRMQMQGMSFDQYLKMTGSSMETFRTMFKDQAERQVKTRLVLEKVAELENIAVSDKEIEDEYAKMAENYGMELDKIKAAVSADALREDLKISDALEFLKKNAKVKKPAAKKKAADEAEETAE